MNKDAPAKTDSQNEQPKRATSEAMSDSIHYTNEPESNQARIAIDRAEPRALRTFTPSQAVLAKSAGIYHWTPEGRRLADFTSGVLVANLGHNPRAWMKRLTHYMQWDGAGEPDAAANNHTPELAAYFSAPTLTAYNAITPLEVEANRRLLASLHATPLGCRLQQVLWSASGSEAIQKSLWACLHWQPRKDIILATRHGFHGKKGLSEAVTGDENAPNRDPRVHFISFPKAECRDLDQYGQAIDLTPYANELEQIRARFDGRLNCLITEPYLGGGGSYHPPRAYPRLLMNFCRAQSMPLILDEVQANFGRTGTMYAFEHYEIEPDIVVLGKGMGNGIPVNATVGRADIFGSLNFGEASDTWSAHPLGCAATLATLDIFENTPVLAQAQRTSARIEAGLRRLKELPIVAAVRGEGMVWGVEFADWGTLTSKQVAVEVVRACYIGDDQGNAIHLLGPLAGNVLRVSPPLTMTEAQADFWFEVMFNILARFCGESVSNHDTIKTLVGTNAE